MSTVWQICYGFNKGTLIGNWNEERQFVKQPFRYQPYFKQPRPIYPSITTYDEKGFQRALPRLNRRTKWYTTHIVPNDGFNENRSRMKLDYPHGQVESYLKKAEKPTDKNVERANSTAFQPFSEVKQQIKDYKVLSQSNMRYTMKDRNVPMNDTMFRSTFSVHYPTHQKLFSYTTYNFSYGRSGSVNPREQAQRMYETRSRPAGSFNPVKNESMKLVTTLYCENHKKTSDLKEDSSVQRSWLPFKDRSLAHSMGKTTNDFGFRHQNQNDIQTSTNANIGIHNLHPKDVNPSFYRHIRQEDVTHRPNKTFSYK